MQLHADVHKPFYLFNPELRLMTYRTGTEDALKREF